MGWQGQEGLKSTFDATKAQETISGKFWFSGMRSSMDMGTCMDRNTDERETSSSVESSACRVDGLQGGSRISPEVKWYM